MAGTRPTRRATRSTWRSIGKSGRPVGWLFGLYLAFAGIERFLVEILRAKDDRFLGPFTLAQMTSAIIVVIGLALLYTWRRGPSPVDRGAHR